MKSLRSFNFKLACCALALCAANAYADNGPNFAATISFSNADDAKWLAYSAYRAMFDVDRQIKILSNLAVKAANGTVSTSDLYYMDLKFQSRKHDLENVMNKRGIWFSAFRNNDITIDIRDDGNGNQLRFHLPVLNTADLGIASDSIISLDKAKMAVLHVTIAINIMNDMLPFSTNSESLKKFTVAKASAQKQNDNLLKIKNTEDSFTLLQSLVYMRAVFANTLSDMLTLATEAASGNHDDQELQNLDDAFQANLAELARNLNSGYAFGGIKTFNDNNLQFRLNEQTREYNFAALNLKMFHLDQDNLISNENAMTAMSDLYSVYDWAADWTLGKNPSVMDARSVNRNDILAHMTR